MATTYSTQYDKIVTNLLTNGIQTRADELSGKLRVAFFQHTCESEAAGSTINLTRIPANSRIIGFLYCCEDLSAGAATISFGDSGDVDRLISAATAHAAATAAQLLTLRTPTTEDPDIGFGYRYTSETDILATTAAAALNTSIMWGAVVYVTE